MSEQHASSCGRRIALEYDLRGGEKEDAIFAIHRHCGVSLLRAHRLAHGYTLAAVADVLRNILNSDGIRAAGIAHQMVSRWENGVDSPSGRYLDALCRLYQTRPDRLGIGHDYSVQAAAAPARAIGVAERPSARMPSGSARVIDLLEQRTEQSGYEMYTSTPAEFVPARMTDLATTQGLLLRSPAPGAAKRLHRIAAKNAGFIAIRLTDVASAGETFNWFSLARQSARHSEDRLLEAWIAGHMSGGYSCYGYSLAVNRHSG